MSYEHLNGVSGGRRSLLRSQARHRRFRASPRLIESTKRDVLLYGRYSQNVRVEVFLETPQSTLARRERPGVTSAYRRASLTLHTVDTDIG